MVKIKSDNAKSQVECSYELLQELREHLSYKVQGAEFATAASPYWDGKVRLMGRDGIFPTGLLGRLIEYLKGKSIPFKVEDVRKVPTPSLSLKLTLPHGWSPRPYQIAARTASEIARGVYVMGTGCLSGDTIVHISRGGNGRKYRLDDAYKSWIGQRVRESGAYKAKCVVGFDKSIPSYTRSFVGDKIGANLIKDIVQSGIKEVWEVTLANGLSLKATACHKFLTDNGFVRLDELEVGSKIMCDLNEKKPKSSKGSYEKKNYRQFQLKHHPYAGGAKSVRKWTLADGTINSKVRRLYRVPYHRVVYEAGMNGMELEDFVLRIRRGDIKGLKFLDPKVWAVHHKDHDHKNNSLDNLEMLSHSDHAKEHTGFERFNLGTPSFSKVKKISFVGEEMTYDIVCDDPWRNFVANKIVVHNSGKSLTSALIVEAKQVPTLIVVPDTGLREQLTEDYRNWFGHRKVGNKLDDDCQIIITNIQAIQKKPKAMFSRFEMLIIDEFHHAAADTYKEINSNCFNAYYRYGFTGTFIRPDGADMEMFGVLSNILFTKSTSELIEEGYLVRPYITVYHYDLKESNAGKRMRMRYQDAYKFLTMDTKLNTGIAAIANQKIKEGKQTLVLVRLKEHGALLQRLIPDAYYLNGSDPRDHREKVKRAFIQRKVKCMIATSIFGEGQDIPSIDVLINARFQKTEIQTMQGIGRALRKTEGKDKAEVFDLFFIGQKNLEDHSVQRLNSYRKESAFRIQVRRGKF